MINEIIQIGGTIIETGATATLIGLLVVLAIPKLRSKIFNGKSNLKNDILKTLETNHFHEVKEILKEMKEQNKTLIENSNRSLYILEDLKNKQ